MNAEQFRHGDRVRYVPSHAHGDPNHPDCETGAVAWVNAETRTVFVKYDTKRRVMKGDEGITAQGTDAEDLIKL